MLALATLHVCQQRGITTVLDTGSGRPWTAELMAEVDHVIASEKFTRKLTAVTGRDAAAALWSGGCRKVFAITRGQNGGVWATGPTPGSTGRWQPAPVEAIDTTGAGDVFHGAYAWALASGMDLVTAIEHAAWASGLGTTRVGNDALPTAAELALAVSTIALVDGSLR